MFKRISVAALCLLLVATSATSSWASNLSAGASSDVTDRAGRLMGGAQERFLGTYWNSAGRLASPGINTVLADTGPLPAGTYKVQVTLASGAAMDETKIWVSHRNAANNADLDVFPLSSLDSNFHWATFVITVAVNERLRIFCAAAAGANVFGAIFAQQVM